MIIRPRAFPLWASLLFLGLAACSKSSAPSSQVSPTTPDTVAATAAMPMPSANEFASAAGMTPLHFAFDRYELRASDLGALDQTARWMKSRPEMMMQIAGHGDGRGTEAYNLALGEQRAQAVRNALAKRGIEATRVTTASYGESRPLCGSQTEGCWAQNRRAEFLVKAK
jgi:peptidoglycan-associated lipoprotein